jgi:FAD/FMN-containing dehydrogenase
MLAPMPYPEIYWPEPPDNALFTLRSKFIDRVDERTAQIMLDQLHASPAEIRIAEFRVLGGAMARVPADATAFAHRSARVMASFIVQYENRDEHAIYDAWVLKASAAIDQGQGVYVNFVGNEGKARLHDAYPKATLERLAAIKAKYDPTNLFHRNQNIAPKAR